MEEKQCVGIWINKPGNCLSAKMYLMSNENESKRKCWSQVFQCGHTDNQPNKHNG